MNKQEIKQSGVIFTDEHGRLHFVPGRSRERSKREDDAEISPGLKRRIRHLQKRLKASESKDSKRA